MILAVVLILAVQDPYPGARTPHRGGGPEVSIDVKAEATMTSNLFHLNKRREREIDLLTAPGERFYDMEGPEDLAFRSAIEPSWKWRIDRKRSFKLSLYAASNWHLDNSIADYQEFGAAARYDLTKDDHLRLEFDFEPTHFRKNYETDAFGPATFFPADIREDSVSLRYVHDWPGPLSTGIEVSESTREYDAPFSNRDRDRTSIALILTVEASKTVDLAFKVADRDNETGSGPEFGIPADRSSEDLVITVSLDASLPGSWTFALAVENRDREFTSGVSADPTYFGRKDDRWKVRLGFEKRVKQGWSQTYSVTWMENDTNRDDAATSEDLGYDELAGEIGIIYTF